MKTGTRTKTNGANQAVTDAPPRTLIEVRAYELWQANGCRDGDDLDHWLRAEHELTNRNNRQVSHERPRRR